MSGVTYIWGKDPEEVVASTLEALANAGKLNEQTLVVNGQPRVYNVQVDGSKLLGETIVVDLQTDVPNSDEALSHISKETGAFSTTAVVEKTRGSVNGKVF